MEAKKFISTLKGFRTRFTNKANEELEKKSVVNLVEKFGGKLEAIATLKENGCDELKDYVKKILGLVDVVPNVGKVVLTDENGVEFAVRDGKVYKLDNVKKTMKRVFNDFADLGKDALELPQMSLQTYQRYLKDNFDGETCTLKKGKLHFRGYRISCDVESGFIVEDTTNKYEIVETPFEGIPTPKELGEWFKKPTREFTAEELREAVERGKHKSKKSDETETPKEVEEVVDFEKLRKKVLMNIERIRTKQIDFDPTTFPEMIPFKRWKRKANSLLSQWKSRKIRYAKFLKELEAVTLEETFVIEEKKHRSAFVGTELPEYESVGSVDGNEIEVDGAFIPAVPFLLKHLLHHEPKAMSQIMKYAAGEITDMELIKNPIEVDWKVEYDKNALENTEHNVSVLCMVYEMVGVTCPQDIEYNSELEVGDKVAIIADGEIKHRTITKVERGAYLGKSLGWLLKSDKWIKMNK